ncbi:hypothetical protein CDAR_520111 [Caerostris darwini]|uniref:Uncharacterized protein n=1 Tax=Caerostris darwini TaxID=1538125 RepID=A0AAV4TVJ4_9ARAC|nr:hypothetical protein CDAR_520111 [Caerostris darwini]
MEEKMLDAAETNNSASICAVSSALKVTCCSVQSILIDASLHALHLQWVQLLLPDDHPTHAYLQQGVREENFTAYVLFTNEVRPEWPSV